MSGLETLPPDQRAVLQLILVQGRGYADLAALLKLDLDAVRSRAHAGVAALGERAGAGHALDDAQRARVTDYLLGQQDDGQRIVTFAELGDSAAACRWAQALRQQLAGIARTELPEVPAAASANGGSATPPAPAKATPAPASPSAAVAGLPPSEPSPSTLAAPQPSAPRTAAQPSRLAGAALIAGAAALAIVLAIVLLGGDDDGDGGSSTSTSTTSAQTQTSARTQPSTTPTVQPRLVAQVNLNATAAGGEAIGIGLVQRSEGTADGGRGQLGLAIEAQRLPANGAQDIYAVWLQGAASSRFLGFVPRQVRAGGRFTVSAALPANARDFSTVLITREGVTAVPQAPGETILSGALRLPA